MSKVANINRQMTAAHRYSYSRLVLNYYMLYELRMEKKGWKTVTSLEKQFHEILGSFLSGEEELAKLEKLRNRVIHCMEEITSYTDDFQAYEYVLNRLEARFLPRSTDKSRETDEERISWIMNYIMEEKNPKTINERIQNVVSQLPVRLTRGKFLSMVHDGLSVYVGAQKQAVKDIFFVVESEALLNAPEGREKHFPKLQENLDLLSQINYNTVTMEQYRDLELVATTTGHYLNELTGEVSLLMDLVNDLYVLLLSGTGAMMDLEETQYVREILLQIFEGARAGKEIDELILAPLEGRQETSYEQWETWATPIEMLEEFAVQDPQAETLRKISLLLSGSSFMDLKHDETLREAVTPQELAEMGNELFERLNASLASQPKALSRAVMAKVLSSLPVFFGTVGEVYEYVKGALESCADEGEKEACMRLIRRMDRE